jgi:hypothetical protein
VEKIKTMNILTIFQIVFGLIWVWIIYEWWSAPMVEEYEDGSWRIVRPKKKISDIFKKK